MADKEDKAKQQENGSMPNKEKKSMLSRLLPLVIMFFVSGLCAGAGFGIGRLLANPEQEVAKANAEVADETAAEKKDSGSSNKNSQGWYYELDPVGANLNEPGVKRYVSASLMLEMSSEFNEKKGRSFLDKRKPSINNWLIIYLSSLSIDDIRGDRKLLTIKTYICDSLNELLFPDSQPQIKDVLIQKFPIQ